MFERVLVAIDGSDHAGRAIEMAGELAKLSKGEVRVVHVHEYSLGVGGPLIDEPPKEADKMVQDAVKSLADQGITASGAVRATHSGRVAAEILDEAADSNCSAVVVASRGLTDLQGIFVGSVAHKLIHLSTLPVVVVR